MTAALIVHGLDTGTGVLSRSAWCRQASRQLALARPADRHALLVIDIDRLDTINRVYGRPVGDAVLTHAGTIVRDVGVAGRVGDDEFVVVMTVADHAAACRRAHQLARALAAPLLTGVGAAPTAIGVTASIGVSVSTGERPSLTALFWAADAALFEAKATGARVGGCDGWPTASPASRGGSETGRE